MRKSGKGVGEGGGDRMSYPEAARPAKHRTSPRKEEGKKKKKGRNKQPNMQRDSVTKQRLDYYCWY